VEPRLRFTLPLDVTIVVLVFSRLAVADAFIRVNQVGFTPDSPKHAYIISSAALSAQDFTVTSSEKSVALTALLGKNLGRWSTKYPNVYLLDLSELKTLGSYQIHFQSVTSPTFRIAAANDLYGPLLKNSLFFFQAQRDGPDVVPSVLSRKPSHLADREAFVYDTTNFTESGFQGALQKISGPMDVSGGWFDAGDYLKFVETASYVTALMLTGIRDNTTQMGPGAAADFSAEARFGLDWLLKMWDPQTKTLYVQVGIGDGNDKVTGDHDIWRLPQADDQSSAAPGTAGYFVKHRPVFRAGPPGSKISPNLAGRLATAFALGYQVFKTSDPPYAARLLQNAREIYDLADTNPLSLVTVFPHEFYPEDQWRDDMEWGAVELYVATHEATDLNAALHWAGEYLASTDQDSMNLYDASGLAHAELCRILEPMDSDTLSPKLMANLKSRLDSAQKRAVKDPFALGYRYGGGDPVPHILGLILEGQLYDELTHSTAYGDFVKEQLDFVLGANPWGTSFIVGAGSTFPFHMQHQVANLAGSLDGSLPVLLGATVDGPTRGKLKIEDTPDGARATPWPSNRDPYAPFNSPTVSYADDVACWQTVEPADDYTIPTALVFARLCGAGVAQGNKR
jgi:hypothetical protein